ncbi:MAG: phosphatidate cytidylyltransferase [Candidatus Omnitrophota bacterium]
MLRRCLIPFSIAVLSFLMSTGKQERPMSMTMASIIGLLVFFTIISGIMLSRKLKSAKEIADRTVAWWWMAAIFLLALATARIASFCFLSLMCFFALREYFHLFAHVTEGREEMGRNRATMLVCYAAIPLNAYLAYINWYGLYIILVPVYLFLLIPLLFVIQDRTDGAIKALGAVSLGIMFFVFNLGHGLFMINLGPMILLYCFTFTEARDLIAFWVGKAMNILCSISPSSPLARVFDAKIAPSINPRKTWGAGIVTAIIVAFSSMAFLPLMPEMPKGRMSPLFMFALGFLIGVLGLMGDLVFSMVKRDIGVKDSGNVLPGHGGVIDRVNSLVFTIPVTFHLINWIYI